MFFLISTPGSAYPYCIHGRTPLHGAAFFGYPQICREILAHPLFLSGSSEDVMSFCKDAKLPIKLPLSYGNRLGADQTAARLDL